MVIFGFPVANSCPNGHENVTVVPKAVSRLDARAPSPGNNAGQSGYQIIVYFFKEVLENF